jgi:hypothetical protein
MLKGTIAGAQFCANSAMEVTMLRRSLMLAVTVGLVMLGSSFAARSEDPDQATLFRALGNAKLSLQQGIAQVAKGTEVPIEAKYEMEGGKLMLSVYTSAKGLSVQPEDNSFVEYKGDVTGTTWAPEKEVFADFKHIARSAQYDTLLSMTKMTIPEIIQKASVQGTVYSVKEKVRNGKPVFEVMTVQGTTAKTTLYDLLTGEPISG